MSVQQVFEIRNAREVDPCGRYKSARNSRQVALDGAATLFSRERKTMCHATRSPLSGRYKNNKTLYDDAPFYSLLFAYLSRA